MRSSQTSYTRMYNMNSELQKHFEEEKEKSIKQLEEIMERLKAYDFKTKYYTRVAYFVRSCIF